MSFNLSDMDRVTLIRYGSHEEECTAENFLAWLDVCAGDKLDLSARTVGALCDAFRQLRNDYDYERARADRAVAALAKAEGR